VRRLDMHHEFVHTIYVPGVSKSHSEHLLVSSLQELHHCWNGAVITGVGLIVLEREKERER